MKWVWWIAGAACYLIYKNEIGTGSVPHYAAQILILLFFSMMGERSARLQKEEEQRRRTREANQTMSEIDRKIAAELGDPHDPRK